MIVKWYVRISSVIGTIVIVQYVGQSVLDFTNKAALFIQQLGSSL